MQGIEPALRSDARESIRVEQILPQADTPVHTMRRSMRPEQDLAPRNSPATAFRCKSWFANGTLHHSRWPFQHIADRDRLRKVGAGDRESKGGAFFPSNLLSHGEGAARGKIHGEECLRALMLRKATQPSIKMLLELDYPAFIEGEHGSISRGDLANQVIRVGLNRSCSTAPLQSTPGGGRSQ